MDVLKSAKRAGITHWKTADGKFSGFLIDPVKLTEKGKESTELPAAALLAVPKHSQNEVPSINKYSPVIAQADSTDDLGPLISAWADRNAGKSLWSLRSL